MLLYAFTAHLALGVGFQINEQDARATGRAGAVTANPSNPSAIYYNPAGIAPLEGFQARVGVTYLAPASSYQDPAGALTSADAQTFFIPNIYATYRIIRLLSVGVGLAPAFGAGIRWPEHSPGRGVLREQALQTFSTSIVVGMDFSQFVDGLSIGGGVDLVPASVYLTRDILFGSDVASLELSGSAFGVGGRAGIRYAPKMLPLSFGVSYRSAVALNFKGTANFTASDVYRPALPPDGPGSTSLTLPQGVNAGIAWKIIDSLELEGDFSWNNWSSFSVLAVTLPNGQTQAEPKNWRDSYAARLALDWSVSDFNLRVGGGYESTAVPPSTLSFDLPETPRGLVTLGIGYQFFDMVRADLGVMYVLPTSQKTGDAPYMPFHKGTFTTQALLAALSVGVKI